VFAHNFEGAKKGREGDRGNLVCDAPACLPACCHQV
jgi:hypothetical protein